MGGRASAASNSEEKLVRSELKGGNRAGDVGKNGVEMSEDLSEGPVK
jgi:hypothetical protein